MFPITRIFILLALVFGAVLYQTASAKDADSQQYSLDCTFRDNTGIFAPQQSILLDVILRPPAVSAPSSAVWTLRAALTDLSKPENPAASTFTAQISPQTPLPVSFVTPENEGVYEITLTAVLDTKPNRQVLNLTMPRVSDPLTVETRRQFVVLNSQPSPRSAGDWTLTDTQDLLPADTPARRKLLSFPKVTELPKIPDFSRPTKFISDLPKPAELLRLPQIGKRNQPADIASNSSTTEPKPRRSLLQLPASQEHFFLEKSTHKPDFSGLTPAVAEKCTWYALPLETEIGEPYLIELDYPADVPQTLGIAVADNFVPTEQFASGLVNTAANIHIAEEIVRENPTETTATHQLLFWATSESPAVVLVNRQKDQEALFGNVRVSRITIPEYLEERRFPKLFEGKAQRKRIGQLLNAESFLQATQIVPKDWQTAYEGCSRLLDILCRGGYDGITLTVLSKEFSLYSPVNDSLNRLEMMFRRFDNEELTFIPAIEFNFLIPSLERLLAEHPSITEEVLIGNPQDRRYNVLHPAVQQAMADIVNGITNRFAHHPSFGGVAIVLSPDSYAQLPFASHRPNDYTFTQFRQETEKELGIPFPDEQHLRHTMPIQQFLVQKDSLRIQFLQSNPQVWETWVRWKAAKASGFFVDLAKQVSTKRTDAPLYLLGGTLLEQPEIRQFCVPTLPRNFTSLQALQLLGFDLQRLSKSESLHFLRPVPITEGYNYCYDRLDSVDTLPLFASSGFLPGVQFVHRDTDDFLAAPVHHQSRKRFVKQLAQADVLMFMESGNSLPFGQESSMFDLLDTYRRLPPIAFQTFAPSDKETSSLQPLTVRYKNMPEGMLIYIVNDAPYAVEADFNFIAEQRSQLTELSGRRIIRSLSRSPQQAGSQSWRASLQPYDLLAIKISDANAKIESVTVHRPPSLCGADGELKKKVEELSQRIHTAQNGITSAELVNAGFELPSNAQDGITGWQCFGKSFSAQQDQVAVCKGQGSVKLTNSSSEAGTFLCQPLNVPATGRLGVSMFVGVPEDCQTLPMNVLLTAKYRGEPFYRSVPVGETLMPSLAKVEPKSGVRWTQLLVPFERERLPLESLEEIRIGIQCGGSGTIWLDEVTVYPVLFSTSEMVELKRLLLIADQRYSSSRYSDLLTQFEGYWAQFLFRHVPVMTPQPMVAEVKPQVAKEISPPPKPTFYQRAKGWFGLGKK